jgi:exo-beta-1,3-glucanase (GH17 family)/cellulose synthase/poly-beta-1,6-N-acetylglucosamine synthase-like glycosyltransferase
MTVAKANTEQPAAGRARVCGLPSRNPAVSVRVIGIIIGLMACAHAVIWILHSKHPTAAVVGEKLSSVSYNRFAGPPSARLPVAEAQIRTDLEVIASQARAIRTYSSTGGFELVPKIAGELGLDVTLGAWIDKNDDRNQREIASAVSLAKRNPNVKRIVVGNETVWRHERTAGDLARIVRQAKYDSPVPVASAENWIIWIQHPELADAVDIIFAHIIPYWEGVTQKTAVEQSLFIYDKLRRAFPGKPIFIGEFGWPSAGYNFKQAVPSTMAQATVLRDFVARANALGIDYNIVEAIDQPQKLFEGSVGPYWGIFDASLHPKFSWTGPIVDSDRWKSATMAILIGVLLSVPLLGLAGVSMGQAGLISAADHVVGDWGVGVFGYWHGHYLLAGEAIAFSVGLPLLGILVPIVLSRIEELAAIVFGGRPERLLTPQGAGAHQAGFLPKVSIHIPAYREPPEMLVETLDAVSRLDYANFECIVIINNTPDPVFWRPVEAHCRELGERFKFINAQDLAGFKAGALRLAMTHTASDAEIIGVLDADYVVDPHWLADLVPSFAASSVGMIQAPQDHRDGYRSLIHTAMNAEYAGFFDIGMVQRNEANAIVTHGTMCLIRREALEAAGGWSSDTICEDTDLGLTILELGWCAHYTNRRYGWGLLPQDLQAFRTQRSRWTSGAVQILKKHWRRFLPGASVLSSDQKREFAFGWLTWFGAECIAVAAAMLNLLFVPFVAFDVVALPDGVLTLPIVAAFLVSLTHFGFAYRLRVAVPFWHMLAAMFVFMSLQWTVASAAAKAAFSSTEGYFHRTPKGASGSRHHRPLPLTEAVLGGFLLASAIVLFAINIYRVLEVDIFAAILVMQSLPFLAAMALAVFEGTRANSFDYWRGIESRSGATRRAGRGLLR